MLAFIANRLAVVHCSQRMLDHQAIFIFNTGSLELTVASSAGDNLCHRKPSRCPACYAENRGFARGNTRIPQREDILRE